MHRRIVNRWLEDPGRLAGERLFGRVVRGTPEKALRAVYEVPADKGFTVGEITVDGKTIEFGAQIADFITIKLTGLATRIGRSTIAPFHGCVRQPRRSGDAARFCRRRCRIGRPAPDFPAVNAISGQAHC